MLPLLVHPDRTKDAPLVEVIRGMAERVGVEGYVRQQTAIMSRADSRPYLGRIGSTRTWSSAAGGMLTPLAMHEELAALIPGTTWSCSSIAAICPHSSGRKRSTRRCARWLA